MRLVVPISFFDAKLLPDFMRAIIHFGQLEGHHVLLIPTPSQAALAEEAAEEFRDKLRPLSVRVQTLSTEPIGGWPSAPNNHFGEAVEIVTRQPEEIPWLWMELDSFPTQHGWLDDIAMAYQNAGKRTRYMGHVIPFQVLTPDNKPFERPGDDMMLGVAVYDHFMGRDKNFEAELRDVRYGNRTDGLGFDQYLRSHFKRMGRSHTDLIADQWNTQNYRMEDINLVCDPVPDTRSLRKRGGIVDPRAVLVHGCKDGSGHKLAALGSIPAFVAPIAATVQSLRDQTGGVPRGTPASDPLIALMAQLVAGQAKTDATLNKLAEAIAKPPQFAIPIPSPTPRKEPVNPPPAESGLDGSNLGEAKGPEGRPGLSAEEIAPAIKAFITEKGKSQPAKTVADHFGMTVEDIQKLADIPENKLKIAGPIKWVSVVTD